MPQNFASLVTDQLASLASGSQSFTWFKFDFIGSFSVMSILRRAGHFCANRMGGKLDVFVAKKSRPFLDFWFSQGHGLLAVRAGDFQAEVFGGKTDVHATDRGRAFLVFRG